MGQTQNTGFLPKRQYLSKQGNVERFFHQRKKRQLFCFRDIQQMSGMLIRSQTYQYRGCSTLNMTAEWDIWKSERESTIKTTEWCDAHIMYAHYVYHTASIKAQLFLNETVCKVHVWVITTSNMCMSGRSYPPGFWAGWTDPPPARPWLLALLNNSCHSATPILMKDRLWLVLNWRGQSLFGHCECPNR